MGRVSKQVEIPRKTPKEALETRNTVTETKNASMGMAEGGNPCLRSRQQKPPNPGSKQKPAWKNPEWRVQGLWTTV